MDPLLKEHVESEPSADAVRADGGSLDDSDEFEDCSEGVALCFECYKEDAESPDE